jgi:hypothetical protein
LGFKPELVFDFDAEKYFTGSSRTTFSDAISHSRASNATMVDSDGVLKWGPHNLLTYSDDISAIPWITTSATINSATQFTFDTDGGYIRRGLTVDNAIYTLKATISGDTPGDTFMLELVDGADGSDQNYTTVTVSETPTEYTVVADMSSGTFSGNLLVAINRTSLDRSITAGSKVTIEKIHVYRSDLGGMVDNPDRGDSYVPTTSSAVYLPRRGHHVYNGDSWVNKGLLHESEARTNLLSASNTWTGAFQATLTDNEETSWTGEVDLRKLTEDTNANQHQSSQSTSLSAATTYTVSGVFKAGTRGGFGFYITSPSMADVRAHWDLSDGSLYSSANATTHVEDLGNGLYRLGITFTTVDGGSSTIREQLHDGTSYLYTGDGSSYAYLGHLQIEEGSTPSSYIPTSGATVTRAAETLTVPAANLPWPTPNVIGSELVTNGTFDTDLTGWGDFSTAPGSTSWDSGTLAVTNSGGSAGRSQQIDLDTPVGRTFRVTFDATNADPANGHFFYAGVSSGSGAAYINSAIITEGENEFFFVPTDALSKISFRNFRDDTTLNIDNVSVREIDPLAVSISMKGQLSYGDDDGFATAKVYNWRADGSNYFHMNIDTASTLTGRLTAAQNFSGTIDFGVGSSELTPGAAVPFDFAVRHGSTFVQTANDGAAGVVNTTPVGLPDLSSTDFQIGHTFNGIISEVRIWPEDIGEAGIEKASA